MLIHVTEDLSVDAETLHVDDDCYVRGRMRELLGEFSDEEHAEDFLDRLRDTGKFHYGSDKKILSSAEVVRNADGQKSYRVYVEAEPWLAQFRTRADAEGYLRKLKENLSC